MEHNHPVGCLDRVEEQRISGWLRSGVNPDRRLSVEILADDAVIASGTANQFRSDLIVKGRFDGQHGFEFKFTDRQVMRGARFISARETDTAQIFARVRISQPNPYTTELARLDDVVDELVMLRDMLDGRSHATGMTARLRAAFGAAGQSLASSRDAAVRAARLSVERLFAGVACPHVADPDVTVVILAANVRAVARLARAAEVTFARFRHEVLVIGTSDDPQFVLLAAVRPAIRVLACNGRLDLAAAMIAADAAARGSLLAVFAEPAGADCEREEILEPALPFKREGMIVGPAASRARGDGEAFGQSRVVDGLSALLVCLERELFRSLGGLDPALNDEPAQAVAELGVRAELCQAHPLWLRHAPAGLRPLVPLQPVPDGWSSLRQPMASQR